MRSKQMRGLRISVTECSFTHVYFSFVTDLDAAKSDVKLSL
jgi:hypothetical protein